MQCPSCGWKAMKKEKRDLPFSYKGRSIVVRAVAGDYCPKCDEAVLGEAGSGRYAAALDRLVKEVNGATMPDLRSIRKRLKLTQSEAADLFGGGVNAFSRYERGETAPPKSLVQIFRLLERQPELLAILRETARPIRHSVRSGSS
ncbi:MAG: type II TA system antitoxin MqsA family protein [Thermoanaerobaculia bacterium]